MASPAELSQIHTQTRSRARIRVMDKVQRLVMAQSDWYDPVQVALTASRVGDLVTAATRNEARLTQSYLSQVYASQGVRSLTPHTPVDNLLRKGVSPAEVYERPFADFRWKVSQGAHRTEALEASMDRLQKMVSTDLQLANREAASRSMKVNRRSVNGFRRILRPELSSGSVCGLCIVAADRVYGTDELLPIHDGCNCDVMPITAAGDPGLNLNREDLDTLYAAAGDTTGASGLSNVKIDLRDHGEIGPTLTDASHRFTTPRTAVTRERPANRPSQAQPNFDAMISSSDRTIRRLEEEIDAGVGDESTRAALEWQLGHRAKLLERASAYDLPTAA